MDFESFLVFYAVLPCTVAIVGGDILRRSSSKYMKAFAFVVPALICYLVLRAVAEAYADDDTYNYAGMAIGFPILLGVLFIPQIALSLDATERLLAARKVQQRHEQEV